MSETETSTPDVETLSELRWQVAGLMNEAEENDLDADEVKQAVIGYAKGRQT